MIKIMKGGIARKLFLMYPEMKKQLWDGHLWNPSYCVVTVSDRSRDMVEHYIESQREAAISAYREVTSEGHMASDCIRCKKCEKACPQHLSITEYLKQGAEMLEV
jgi:ferredoxin